VDIYIEPVRVYPQGTAAAHVLGYVGKADPRQDSEEPYHFYLPEMSGSRGMEAVMNSVLTGMPGGRLLRVDASGYKHEQIAERAPECGRDVQLALDVRLQRLAEEVLVGREGAVVVLDPSNGDVLAMASSPAFDPNAFGPGLRQGEWARLLSDRSQPLVNRAIAEVYPPGSTFKPVVALAALLSDRAAPGTAFDCPGYFQLGGTRFHCWRTSGHGSLDMRGAIEQSCNSYFCQLGLRIGYDRIQAVAAGVGFGRKTGIELAGEAPGLLGGGAWKQRAHRDAWRPGDTCNASIGQGYLAVTPLQMAVLTSAIANGGRLYRPRLLRTPGGAAGEQGGPLGWTASALALVRQGMYDVVNAESGTGKRARVEGVEMAGKTGTAEYGPRGNRRKHTWMLAFAPFEHPRIALAIVIEDGMSGGITVAPRVRRLVGGYFNVEVPPVPPDEAVESG
jgi:penicillin-binding protein 2